MECLVCRGGIGDSALEFWGVTICQRCQDRLMDLTVDQEEYESYLSAMRDLWQKRFQAARDRRLKDGDSL